MFGTAIAPAMENITYSNCTVHGALAGIRIKFRPTQFGFVRNILFEILEISCMIYNPYACESACSYLLRTA